MITNITLEYSTINFSPGPRQLTVAMQQLELCRPIRNLPPCPSARQSWHSYLIASFSCFGQRAPNWFSFQVTVSFLRALSRVGLCERPRTLLIMLILLVHLPTAGLRRRRQPLTPNYYHYYYYCRGSCLTFETAVQWFASRVFGFALGFPRLARQLFGLEQDRGAGPLVAVSVSVWSLNSSPIPQSLSCLKELYSFP